MMLDRKAPKDDIGHYLIKKGTELYGDYINDN